MKNNKTKNEHPLGGWFGTIGGFIGLALGIDFGGSFIGAIIGMVVGAYIGIAVEHIVAKVLIFLFGVMIFLGRRELLGAMFEAIFS